MLEFSSQTLAFGNQRCFDLIVDGEGSEKEQQAKSIIKITQSIDKAWITIDLVRTTAG
jgi:hypothetical protein